jgi:hypothetical protein
MRPGRPWSARGQAVGLVQRVAALAVDDGLQAALGADDDAVSMIASAVFSLRSKR